MSLNVNYPRNMCEKSEIYDTIRSLKWRQPLEKTKKYVIHNKIRSQLNQMLQHLYEEKMLFRSFASHTHIQQDSQWTVYF